MARNGSRRPRSKSFETDAIADAQRDSEELDIEESEELAAPPRTRPARPAVQKFTPTKLRIVAGEMGGRKILYSGDPAIRPMKEKTGKACLAFWAATCTILSQSICLAAPVFWRWNRSVAVRSAA